MSRVGIIIPYFGKWPPYFNLFLKSCFYNGDFTVLFFTDLPPPKEYPKNVEFHHYTLDGIRHELDQLVGFKTSLTNSYKLCDVRPAFGLIFKDYISRFDFWGWGDIDLIYGRIGNFITEDLFLNNHVISCRKGWLSGSFCLIKNTETLNRLFLTSNDLNKIFTTENYMGFDEISRCWDQIKNRSFEEMEWPHDNFTRIVLGISATLNVKLHFADFIKESIPDNDYLIWNEGRLVDNHRREYSHYHFIIEKRRQYFQYPHWNSVPIKFFVTQSGFYTEKEFENYHLIHIKRVLFALPAMAWNFFQRGIKYFNKISHSLCI